MTFGSTTQRAIESMFEGFVHKIYDGFETIARLEVQNQTEACLTYLGRINTLLEFGR